MKIDSESRIHHPRDRVFAAYRDRLPEVAEYIPDIKEIKVLSREEGEGVIKLHNEWVGATEIPSAFKMFLKPEHLRWDDFATWKGGEWACEWQIKTRVFTDAVKCSGRNVFHEDGEGRTRVKLAGDLTIKLEAIPGVPGFLGRRLAPQVEKFIVNLITPNLERVNASLEKFMDEKGA